MTDDSWAAIERRVAAIERRVRRLGRRVVRRDRDESSCWRAQWWEATESPPELEDWLDRQVGEAVAEYVENGYIGLLDDRGKFDGKVHFSIADASIGDAECSVELAAVIGAWIDAYVSNVTEKIDNPKDAEEALQLRAILAAAIARLDEVMPDDQVAGRA